MAGVGNRKGLLGRVGSPVGFVLAGLCFLLPFMSAGCSGGISGQKIEASATYTGVDLVMGGKADLSMPVSSDLEALDLQSAIKDSVADFSDSKQKPLPADPLAMAAMGCICLGVLGALIGKTKLRRVVGLGAALAAGLTLTGAELRAKDRIATLWPELSANRRPPGLQSYTDIKYGFWIAVGVLGVIALGHLVGLFRGPSEAQPEPGGGGWSDPGSGGWPDQGY